MKVKNFTVLFSTILLTLLLVNFNGCGKMDNTGTGLGISNSMMSAGSMDPKPQQKSTTQSSQNSSQKWNKMIATDINSYQKGSSNKNLENTVFVVSLYPVGQTRNIDETDEISITFSEPVAPLQKIVKNELSLIEIVPALKGEGYWKSPTTYSFRIDQKLKLSFRFDVRFKGYKTFSGKQIPERKWSFNTPVLSIYNSRPYNNDKWQTLDQKAVVHFSQDVNPSEIAKFISIKTPDGFPAFTVRTCTKAERKTIWAEEDKNTERYIIVIPQSPLPIASNIEVLFKKGLPPKIGNIGLESDRVIKFRTYENFDIKSVVSSITPGENIRVTFSNPVVAARVTDKLGVTPKATILKGGDWDSDYLYIGGKFFPGTTYKLAFPADLKDKFGNSLGSEKTFNVVCLDYNPVLAPPYESHFVLENYLDLDIPVYAVNAYETDVNYRKLDVKDLRKIYISDEYTSELNPSLIDSGTCSSFTWKLPIKKNRPAIIPFDLKPLNITTPGYYFMHFTNTPPGDNGFRMVFQLTDTAVVAKFSPTQVFLVPFNMKTGEIIPNQSYKIYKFDSTPETLLGTVNASPDGTAIYQPSIDVVENKGLKHLFVFSEPHKSFVWSKKYDMFDMWNFRYTWGSSEGGGYYDEGYNSTGKSLFTDYLLTFTDKYLYKGGQSVKFKGILRRIVSGPLLIPSVKQIKYEVFDSRNQSIYKASIAGNAVNSYGSFAGEFNLPQDAPTGFYRIAFDVNLGNITFLHNLSFSVQEYKPSKFEVNVTTDQSFLISGQNLTGNVNGRYLFGTPMKQAEGNDVMTVQSTFFVPTGWEAYTFGTYESPTRETIDRTNFSLDDEGNFKFGKKPLVINGKNSAVVTIYGEVKDKDNNRISGSKSITVHRGEYYIGVKTGSYFFTQGQPGKLLVISVSPDGRLFKNTNIDMKIIREDWKSFQQKDATGALRWEWKKSEENVLNETLSLSDGKFEKEYKFDKPGFYIVKLSGEDKLKNTVNTDGYFYVTGSGYVSWGVNEGRILDIVTDKQEYKPGESIQVLIKSPFETSTAMVTVEREKVIWSKVVQLKGNANTIAIPVQKEFMPNAYINVIILKERTGIKFDENGNDTGKPEFYAGYKMVKIDASEKKLNIEITPDKKSYEPGEEVKLDIKVTDKKGSPVQSEMCISVVDKGVLNLVGYQLPDPFEYFWSNRALAVKTVSTLNDVLGRRKYGEKGENPGGDGSESAFGSVVVRKNFKESAYYTAFITTDNKGKARVTFKLPDNLTTFKAMAAAGTIDDRFGRGSNDILVKQRLILKPAVPDFIRSFDKYSAGVTVTNNSDEKYKVAVQIISENARLEKGEDNIQKISLNPGETQPVWFKFQASESMLPVKLTFKAAAGKASDGLEVEIPIRMPQFTEAVATFGRVEDALVNEQLIVPDGTVRSLDKVEITLASSAMVGIKRNFDMLQEYTYDCLEQRISKQYPIVGAGDFLLTYKLLDMSKEEMANRVNGLLKIMPQFQTANGGFKYYPDCFIPSAFLTCYAVDFLIDARNKKYNVDSTMLRKAEDFLKLVANQSIDATYPYSNTEWFLTRAYAVYALAKDNIFMKDVINNLFDVRDRIPFTGLAYLIKALDIKNNLPAYMQPVLAKTMLNKMKDQPTMTHFENSETEPWWWVHESNVKTTSIVLESFLTVYGKFPYAEKIARWLTTTTNQKRFFSTQDHIWLFMAFEKYYRTFEKETPNFVAEVLFNGLSKIKENFSARELTARTNSISLSQYPIGSKINTQFKKSGTGILYYLLRMKYFPAGEVQSLDRGFKVEKVYKNMDGTPVKDNIFKAGEKYIVEINVETKMEHPFVMLDDPVPAGFKVMNPSFATTSGYDLKKTSTNTSWQAYWGSFYRSEVYFDRVTVFADYLKRGKHTWKYLVIATNTGTYFVPNTVTSEMYNLEVFGRNSNRNITIK